MRKLLVLLLLFPVPLVLYSAGEDGPGPEKILQRVVAAYEALETYQTEGRVVTDMRHGGHAVNLETTFSIRLKKPNFYLVTWESGGMPMRQRGAIWNTGDDPYLFLSFLNGYSKMGDDEITFATATGVSGGVAYTVPSLFFGFGHGKSFDRLTSPELQGSETVEGIECYLIASPSRISREERLWISKESYLLVRYSRSLEVPEDHELVPTLSDEEVDATVTAMGMELTDDNRERIRETMRAASEQIKTADLSGTLTEFYRVISHPDLGEGDFVFELPEGVEKKDSLFEGMPMPR